MGKEQLKAVFLSVITFLINGIFVLPKLWPVGRDFPIFFAASALTLSGNPQLAYNVTHIQSLQPAIIEPFGWFYPPIFFIVVLPLALLPPQPAMIIWLGGTLLLFLYVLYRIAPSPVTLLLGLAFPGTTINFVFAQNAYLSAALFAGGLLLLRKRPFIAGLLLGCLSYKPQLAILIPCVLVAAGLWRSLAGFVSSAAGLTVIATLAWGFEPWKEFFHYLHIHSGLVMSGVIPWRLIPTTLAGVLALGGTPFVSWVLQCVVMITVICVVTYVWRSRASVATRNAILGIGALLFPPYCVIYDLVLLAIPLVWLWREAKETGWLPGEGIFLHLCWFLPLIAPPVADLTRISIVPPVLIAFMFLTLRRIRANKIQVCLSCNIFD